MIIVAGYVRVDPAERDAYVAGCRVVVEQARRSPGCLDFHIGADLVEADRVAVYERWTDAAAVEAFRGSGPSGEQAAAIRDASVAQYTIAGEVALA